MSPLLPVPAVKGGAIETLIEEIINVNEDKKKVFIDLYCIYDSYAKKESEVYKYTEFFFIRRNNLLEQMLYFLYRAFRKILNLRISCLDAYHNKIFSIIKKKKYDLLLVEGGAYIYEYKNLSQVFDKKKMVIHLHAVFSAPRHVDDIFGSAIAISEYVAKKWNLNSNMNLYVLKNSIDSKKFKHIYSQDEKILLRKKYGIESGKIVYLFVGRIIKEKGVKELCQAFASMNDNEIVLIIVGKDDSRTGHSTSYYQKICRYSKEDNRIMMLGYIDNESMSEIYHISDVMIIPSMCEEGAGLVVQEAMVSGLPLIVSDSGGIGEYTCQEGVVIVQRKQIVEELKKAIIKMKNEEIRITMGKENLKYSLQYNSENYYKDFIDIINSIGDYE